MADAEQAADRLSGELDVPAVAVSAWRRSGFSKMMQLLLQLLPPDFGKETITGSLAAEGDRVLLVMPQDKEAPKGRLILPQVQTIRELLDKRCIVSCCTPDKLAAALASFRESPHLIITDSQVFPQVFEQKPADSRLTSFSVLFAAYKGDAVALKQGAESPAYRPFSCADSRSLCPCAGGRGYRQGETAAPVAQEGGRGPSGKFRQWP